MDTHFPLLDGPLRGEGFNPVSHTHAPNRIAATRRSIQRRVAFILRLSYRR